MRSQLEALNKSIVALPSDYRDVPVKIKNSIQRLLDELSEASLDQNQFISPKFPNPFGSTINPMGYKAYLEERNPKIELYSVLVKEGLRSAVAEDNGSLNETQKVFVKAAIRSVDQISEASPQPSVDQAQLQVQAIIRQLKTDLGAVGPAVQTLTPTAREFEILQLEIQSISKLIWLVYGVLTALSGLAVLILKNAGYGIPLDFLFAFFWGFGLPTAIQGLVPGSVASALQISVPKG